jgi:hypothetical protein
LQKDNGAFGWPQCVADFKAKDLTGLGNERWYSCAFCAWLHEKKLVGLHNGRLRISGRQRRGC